MITGTKQGTIRWMTLKDAEQVLAIQRRVFGQAWSADRFRRWLNKRSTVGKLVLLEGHAAGYVLYELAGRRIRIVELGIEPGCRRQGLATTLIEKLKKHLCGERRQSLSIKIAEENLAAQLFLRQAGFRATQLEYAAGGAGRIAFEFHTPPVVRHAATPLKPAKASAARSASPSLPMVNISKT